MIYLASPYSAVGDWTEDQKIKIRERRYRHTRACQAALFNLGYPVFCTIVHTHQTAKFHDLPTDAKPWIAYNHHMIDLSRAVFVLKLHKWEESIGVKDEIDYATRQAIPLYDITVSHESDTQMGFNIPVIPELMTLRPFRPADTVPAVMTIETLTPA